MRLVIILAALTFASCTQSQPKTYITIPEAISNLTKPKIIEYLGRPHKTYGDFNIGKGVKRPGMDGVKGHWNNRWRYYSKYSEDWANPDTLDIWFLDGKCIGFVHQTEGGKVAYQGDQQPPEFMPK